MKDVLVDFVARQLAQKSPAERRQIQDLIPVYAAFVGVFSGYAVGYFGRSFLFAYGVFGVLLGACLTYAQAARRVRSDDPRKVMGFFLKWKGRAEGVTEKFGQPPLSPEVRSWIKQVIDDVEATFKPNEDL